MRAAYLLALGIAIGMAAGSAWLARAQSTTTPFTTGIVVSACGTAPFSAGQWTYATGTQAPITMTAGGALCVNQ